MADATDWDLFDRPAPLVNMASRSFLRLGERRVKPLGFSVGQLPVLYLLRDGKAMSQRDLARAVRVEQPSMAQILARMERDGLIRRTPMPGDGRSQLVSLTKAAIAKLPAARKALHRNQDQALAGFSAVETATLLDLLRRLNRNLDRIVTAEMESDQAVDA
ncbi:MarR family transcriptional regulator [Bradyrhizobium sp. LTSP885]|uniref:MarR family winged helix-turn-helix transcriptional regulator n=1 Tax=Bradyrhizobium sp. LTSP885 TaxID=1619232 RepID=UPI0005C8B984|nr:MarR family transcriptional regulator [Bradyrhizobium sp. LTSP885]KJC40309.1 MarR family transcriptional regulator [Bradyrhizobium sp. LTSP885]